MNIRFKAVAGAAMSIAVLAIGCGDDDVPAPPTPRSDFVRQVDRLCTADQRRTDQAGPKFDAAVRRGRLDVAANLVLKLKAAEARTIIRIEAINPPEADAAGITEFLRLSRRLNELDTSISGAVRAENLVAFRATRRVGDNLEFRRAKLAKQVGLEACGSR